MSGILHSVCFFARTRNSASYCCLSSTFACFRCSARQILVNNLPLDGRAVDRRSQDLVPCRNPVVHLRFPFSVAAPAARGGHDERLVRHQAPCEGAVESMHSPTSHSRLAVQAGELTETPRRSTTASLRASHSSLQTTMMNGSSISKCWTRIRSMPARRFD